MEPQAEAVTTEATEAATEAVDLHDATLYQNRELSWLDFNERVLERAEEDRTPLLERAKFLAIFTSNLDEHYMVRVAGLHDQVDAGIDARGPDGLSPGETIERIADRARDLSARHSRQWEEVIAPELRDQGIRVIDCEGC